jgi:hypothetical protein
MLTGKGEGEWNGEKWCIRGCVGGGEMRRKQGSERAFERDMGISGERGKQGKQGERGVGAFFGGVSGVAVDESG